MALSQPHHRNYLAVSPHASHVRRQRLFAGFIRLSDSTLRPSLGRFLHAQSMSHDEGKEGHEYEKHSFVVSGTRFEITSNYKLIKPIGHGAYGVVVCV